MKVLFVSSGNSKQGISPIIIAQGESLMNSGVDLSYFTVKGKGIIGYISNYFPLFRLIRQNKYEVIHAHYSLCGFLAGMTGHKYIVCSLMGSDIQVRGLFLLMIKIFSKFIWKKTIVKSIYMKKKIGISDCYVIPNGVDLRNFKPQDLLISKRKVNFNIKKKQIVWVSNPSRYEKNFDLAKQSVAKVDNNLIELKPIYDVPHNKIIDFMNAADMLLLTSRWEGSPNVIKEAMALNIPIVSTDVGDVKDIVNDTEGCFVVTQDVNSVAEALVKCLDFGKRTNGRKHISDLASDIIATRIGTLYKKGI